MKKILIIPFICCLLTSGFAQIDRSQIPQPGPAPEIQFGKAEYFTLDNGLKVFVIQNTKLPRVTFSLILDRDPIKEGDKAGMLDFVGPLMTAGTENRTKDEFNEEIDFIGARISASSTSISGSSLTKHQEKVMELMADVLYNPVFPEEELQKLKTQAKSGLAIAKNDPSSISSTLSSKLVYGADHPYGETETEKTIDNISVEDIKKYHGAYFKPNISYLAIVGDIDLATAKQLVNKNFSQWKKGEVPRHEYDMPDLPEENVVALVDRAASQQSVIKVTYPIEMNLPNENYLPTRILNFALGGGASSRLFMNLREDKGYTYGANSSIGADKLVASFSAGASVKGTATDSAIHEIIYEIRNLRENGITGEELEIAKANLSGSFGRSLESPTTIAVFAINTEIYNLPDDYYSTYLQRLNAVTVEKVNQAAQLYLKPDNMYITVVGNAGDFQENLLVFGKVKRFTNMGEPEKEIQMTDADMTAQMILDKYLEAIGGEEKAKSIKTAKIESSAEIQGMKLTMVFTFDEPEQSYNQKILMMGNVASNTDIKNGKATVSAGGQSQELTDEQYESAKMNMFIFPELHFEDLGYTIKLDGIKDVEGEDAYKVIVSNPTGAQQVNYYSVATGLKLKNENAQAGDTLFSAYEEVDGVMYPMEMTIKSPMIPFPLDSKVDKIEFNAPVLEAEMN